MKKSFLIIVLSVFFVACDQENSTPENTSITLKFTHYWNETPVTSADFNTFQFTNKNGDLISINDLRYLLSNISIGDVSVNYQLINIGENSGLELKINNVSIGIHPMQFTFGFADADNQNGIYQDLNSVSFNVPEMLGGGYHYMQFDGKYKNQENRDANFNYHAIRAVKGIQTGNLQFEDTSFLVDLGNIDINNNATIEIKMNIAEWFKNPTTWNLNERNTLLMGNFEAQKIINANGKTVFSLGKINQ